MSASEALNPQQFVHHSELPGMLSGDHSVYMRDVLPKMHSYADHMHERGKYSQGASGVDEHIANLASDISKNGMHEPIEVLGGPGPGAIMNGHHRALAAMSLKMERVPVRYTH